MSLKYGLNVKKGGPAPPKRPAFDDEDDGEDNLPPDEPPKFTGGLHKPKTGGPPPPPKRKTDLEDRQNLSSAAASKARLKEAEELDAAIFDYDSFHDAKASVTEAKKAQQRQEAIERKPKYINNLLDAAARRKQDQMIAREKLLQKERENEGDEFADKEKFVTGAYKQQQEEARRLEAEEKKKVEEEEERRRKGGGGMQGLYKTMIEQTEKQHQETMEAALKVEKEGAPKTVEGVASKTDADLVAEAIAKGSNVQVNEEGQIVDKRELLTAGLNVAPKSLSGSRNADHLKTANRPSSTNAFRTKDQSGSQQAQRERQSRMIEEQIAAQEKRKREEEEEERQRLEKAARSSKTEKDVSDAKARYLARKAAKEKGGG